MTKRIPALAAGVILANTLLAAQAASGAYSVTKTIPTR